MTTFTNSSTLPIYKNWSKSFALGAKIILTLFLLSSFSSLKLFAQNPGIGGTRANFEIDANFKSGSIPSWWNSTTYPNTYTPGVTTYGDDWSGPNPVLKQKSVTINGGTQIVSDTGRSADGRAVWHVDGNWGGGSAVPELVSFAGNSNKNGDNIAAGQHPYSLQLGGSGPQKNDITNTYLFSRQVMGSGDSLHTWLFFGAETRATNGNSYIDFEYNQAGVTIVNNAQLVGNGPVNGRSVGDFLLVINYTGGGNRPIIGVRKWLVSGTWSAELPITETQFITTNSDFVDPVAPNKAFASDGSYANTVMPLQFMEGGVDISDLKIAELDLCTANATVTVKTRSSSSYTAELKDLDVINFSLLPSPGLTDLTSLTKCPGESAAFSTTASGDGATAAGIKWYKVTGTAPNEVETAITTGITTNGLTSTLTISSVTASDAGKYRARLTGASCGEPTRDATLTVNENAALTALTNVTKCPGTSETASFSTTVSGTGASASNVEWYFGTTKLSNGTKYTIAVSGSTSTLTINGIAETDEGSYKAQLTGATCNNPNKSGTLTVNPVPDADAGTAPADQCYIANGNTFYPIGTGHNGNPSWAVAPGGNPNNYPVVITNGSTFAPTVKVTTGTSGGTVTLRLTVTSNQTPACGSATSDVIVKVIAQVGGPNVEMQPITCTSTTFDLKVTNPVSGTTYSLTQPLNGNTKTFTPITYNGTGSVIFTGLTFGDGYRVIASKGGCESAPTECGTTSGGVVNRQTVQTQEITLDAPKSKPSVLAAPNPFNDRIKFTLKSAVSGQGSLELYNTLGQKVKTVFQGYVEAGQVQNIEYAVPGAQRSNLVYVFRVGTESTSGKLIGLRQ